MEKRKIVISQVLPRLLKEKGITAKQLSKETGVSQSTLSTWCIKGSKPRNVDDVALVAEYFGVSLNTLLFDEAHKMSDLTNISSTTVIDEIFKIKLERIVFEDIHKKNK